MKNKKGKFSFSVNEGLQQKAREMTWLTISRAVGWNNGSTAETLYKDSGLSDNQINTIFNMYLLYFLIMPDLNPFLTELYKCTESNNMQALVDRVDEFLLTDDLPESDAHKEKIVRERNRKILERKEAKERKASENLAAFEDTLLNPKPHEEITYAYTSLEGTEDNNIAF